MRSGTPRLGSTGIRSVAMRLLRHLFDGSVGQEMFLRRARLAHFSSPVILSGAAAKGSLSLPRSTPRTAVLPRLESDPFVASATQDDLQDRRCATRDDPGASNPSHRMTRHRDAS